MLPDATLSVPASLAGLLAPFAPLFTAPSFRTFWVAIEDSKQVLGCGQARNRTAAAVRRTIPFQLTCQTLAMTWYATAGHHPADVDDHRNRAPWYTTKTQPSTADMLAKLRRVLIAARFKASRPDQPTREEMNVITPGLGRPRRITAKAECNLTLN